MIPICIDASRWIPEAVQAKKLVRGKPVQCYCVLGAIAKELGVLVPYMTTTGAIAAIAAKLGDSDSTRAALNRMLGFNDTGKMGVAETQRCLVQEARSIGIALTFTKNPHEEMRARKDAL